MKRFDWKWLHVDLQLESLQSQSLDSEWEPETEGPVLDPVEENYGGPSFAPVGPVEAFGGVHGVTPRRASGRTELEEVEGLGHRSPELAASLLPVPLELHGRCAVPLLEVYSR